MPKPTEQIMAWIGTLSPTDELAVRLAFSLSNPWCREDNPWRLRTAELEAKLIKTETDRRCYEERAAKIASDMDGAVGEMKAQFAGPAAAPNPPA